MPPSNQKPLTAREARCLHTLKLTSPASKIWETLPGPLRRELLNSVACFNCEDTNGLGSEVSGRVCRGMLKLHGKCNCCGAEIVRIFENEHRTLVRP